MVVKDKKKRYTLFKRVGDWLFSHWEADDDFRRWKIHYEFNSKYKSHLMIGGAGLPSGVFMIYDHKEKKRLIEFRASSQNVHKAKEEEDGR